MAEAAGAAPVGSRRASGVDRLEQASRRLTQVAGVLAVLSCLIAPLLAIQWSHRPFPGFLAETTAVIDDTNGEGWTGRAAGLGFRHLVLRVGGLPVSSGAELNAALASYEIGQSISVFTRLPDGTEHLFPEVLLTQFPLKDLVGQFWLPYAVGLAYLAIGAWIYRVRGQTRPGRALAFFCFCASVTTSLFFDVSTTHVGASLWAVAMAQLGGALLSLAMRFPEEWRMVQRRAALLAAPYVVSVLLGAWGVWSLGGAASPWAYIPARNASFRFAALGAIVFLGTTLYRAASSRANIIRRQSRIVLVGSLVAFLPIVVWFVTPLFGILLHFNAALFLPSLILFPLSVAVAIFRYRLLEIEAIVNRTIFYGVVTAVLTGIFAVSISVMQKLFTTITGEASNLALFATTLIVVSALEPIKARTRLLIDRRLKEQPDHTQELRAFGDEVRCFLEMSEPRAVARRLLEEAARGLGARSGAVNLLSGGRLETVHAVGPWRGEAVMAVPLEAGGERYGLLVLGPRVNGVAYTRQELDALAQVAGQVAFAIRRAVASNGSGPHN